MTAPSRRWFRFGLRTLFVVVTVIALLCGGMLFLFNDPRVVPTSEQMENLRDPDGE